MAPQYNELAIGSVKHIYAMPGLLGTLAYTVGLAAILLLLFIHFRKNLKG